MTIKRAIAVFMRGRTGAIGAGPAELLIKVEHAARQRKLHPEKLLTKIFTRYAGAYCGPASGVPLARHLLGEMVNEGLKFAV
jgi:hypothetical protein